MSEEIKPCPFCNSTYPEEVTVERASELDYRVVCSSGHKAAWCENRKKAIEDWNKAPRSSKVTLKPCRCLTYEVG